MIVLNKKSELMSKNQRISNKNAQNFIGPESDKNLRKKLSIIMEVVGGDNCVGGSSSPEKRSNEKHINEISDEAQHEISMAIHASARQSIRPYNTQVF